MTLKPITKNYSWFNRPRIAISEVNNGGQGATESIFIPFLFRLGKKKVVFTVTYLEKMDR